MHFGDGQWASADSPIPAPFVPSPAPVTQDELSQLEVALRRRREADRLRKSILDRLRAGAGVENGRLTARIEQRRVRQVPRAALAQMWGNEYVEHLRQHLPETVQRHLKISDQSNQAEM